MKNKKIQKLFFEDYFSSVKILLDKIDYEKLIKISDFVEKSIKSKKKNICCWKWWLCLCQTIFYAILIKV